LHKARRRLRELLPRCQPTGTRHEQNDCCTQLHIPCT
jgi:hypothetical protein